MGTDFDSIKRAFTSMGLSYDTKDNTPDGLIAIVIGCTALMFNNTTGDYLYTEDGTTGARILRKK